MKKYIKQHKKRESQKNSNSDSGIKKDSVSDNNIGETDFYLDYIVQDLSENISEMSKSIRSQ